MIFFIADTHFGDSRIIKRCGRPFSNAEEMDVFLIEAWNGKVGKNDAVYIVGDLFCRHKDPEAVLKQLNGRKHLILGEHDGAWLKRLDCSSYFQSVGPYAEITVGKRRLVLCHYPMMTWNRAPDSYMIHGHIHNDTAGEYWPLIKNDPSILNAGVDVNGFWPVTFEQMVINNECFKEGWRIGECSVGCVR